MNEKEMKKENLEITTRDVESKLISLRGQMVILDRDVAALYETETKRVNEAVRNNSDKFPQGYIMELTKEESDFAVENFDRKSNSMSRYHPKAFTERGLYMLATILKSPRAVKTTLSIIETYAQMREMARTMEQLQDVVDGGAQQKTLLQKTGEILADVIGRNLSTESTETEMELNFAVVKIRHKITKKK